MSKLLDPVTGSESQHQYHNLEHEDANWDQPWIDQRRYPSKDYLPQEAQGPTQLEPLGTYSTMRASG